MEERYVIHAAELDGSGSACAVYATGARDHGDEEAVGTDVGVDHRSERRDEEWLGVLDLSSALDQLRVLAGRYGQLGSAARWSPVTP
jgi:hypothetical protein